VVAGAPNVGKSSLVNALAGHQRCIVNASPGTTRDVISTALAIDGWPVELMDTAGLREGSGSLERQGIELARNTAQSADLCLWILDASTSPLWPDFEARGMQVIINKVDLQATWDLSLAADAIRVSATTGSGLDSLCQSLSRWLVPNPPTPGTAVPFTAALCDQVEDAWRCYSAGRREEASLALTSQLSGITPAQ
jgi:tRNA modification GTPase